MSRVVDRMTTARTWNSALSYGTTGSGHMGACLDYFSKAGTYAGRSQADVDNDMVRIFNDDPVIALAIMFGLRLITRKPRDLTPAITEVQTGYGRKDEFYKAIHWLTRHYPEVVSKNLPLIPVFGSWKDFFQEEMLNCLNWNEVAALANRNLSDQLLLKYLPQRRSKGNIRSERDRKRSMWAANFCYIMGITPRFYRKMKANGQAHLFQKQMGHNEWDQIDFKKIPGKAMLHLTSRKGKKDHKTAFERHGQVDRLLNWVNQQPTVKFNGYPHELVQAARKGPSLVQQMVYNKQFDALLELMKGHKLGNVLAVLDTSGSMGCVVAGKTNALDICVSMGLVFSALNTGYFKDWVCMFDDTSRLLHLAGTFCQRLGMIPMNAMGSTNFQSVIDLLVRTRKSNPDIPVNEYPETAIVISDMQFNPAGYYSWETASNPTMERTNYEEAMDKLRRVGLGNMRLIWWCVNGQTTDFPCQMNDKGCYMIGGFDPTNLKALMGLDSMKKDFVASEKVEETPLDGMLNFLSQPIFSLISH